MPFPLLIPAFFFSAWLAMIFWGMIAPDVGVATIGYPKAMLATIGLWLVVFPLARRGGTKGGRNGGGKEWRRGRSKRRGGGDSSGWQTHSEDTISISSVFTGAARRITSEKFRGGSVTANFGGVQLDLSEAQLADREVTLDVRAFLGGVELLVPRGWDVETELSTVMGGITDERSAPGERAENGPRLRITGSVFLGGLSLNDT